jgi:hypothetical protein
MIAKTTKRTLCFAAFLVVCLLTCWAIDHPKQESGTILVTTHYETSTPIILNLKGFGVLDGAYSRSSNSPPWEVWTNKIGVTVKANAPIVIIEFDLLKLPPLKR